MTLSHKLFGLLCLLLPVQLGYHLWPLSSYVMGLRIDYLAPTIYLTDILVLAILGLWGIEKVNPPAGGQNLKLLIFPISIFIFLLVNSLLAQNPGAALYKFAKIIEFSLLGLYVAKNNYVLRVTYYVLPIAVLSSSLLAIAQFTSQSSLGGPFWWLGERTFTAVTPGIAKAVVNGELIMRPYATFPHPNALAGFLLIGLILTFPVIRRGWLVIGVWLLATGAIAISFSRSVWLVGLLAAVGYRRRRASLLAGLLLVIGYLFFGSHFLADEAIFQRLQLIKAAILMIQSNPLSGVGLNNFLVRLPEFWGPIGTTFWLQPVHNIFLLVAAETGLVGLLIFLWFLILTVKKLLIINSKLLIALSAILALGLFDHYWLTLQQTQLLLTIVLGLSWAKAGDSVKYS